MEPIINIKYLTDDPEIRAMVDMYWALKEDGTHKYKKPDFLKNFGMNTHVLSFEIGKYYEAYCTYDMCTRCSMILNHLKRRWDKYRYRGDGWQCYECDQKDRELEKKLQVQLQEEIPIQNMEEAFEESKHHTLPNLKLKIFKALIRENYFVNLNEQFGMSKVMFLKYVNQLQALNLLRLDQNSNCVFILDEYKNLFENDLPEKKFRSIFGDNNLKIYQQLKQNYPYVFPEIPVCAFIESRFVEHLFTEKWHKNYFLSCRVDALVCENNGEPRFAVEFQGSYHTEPGQKERDELKKSIIEEVGLTTKYYTYKDLNKNYES